MSLTYLLDTSGVIRHLRGSGQYTSAISRMGVEHLSVSVITLAELAEGIYRASDPDAARKAVQLFMAYKVVLDITPAICDRFGKARAGLREQNLLIGDMDLFIAGTCLEHGLTLLTTNRKHFERIGELQIVSDPAAI